jgi:chaperonin GroEL (HSP60 family)
LQDIRVIKKLGGTVEDTELIDGLVFTQKSANVNGPRRVEKAKIGLIQFCISPPKTDVSSYLPCIMSSVCSLFSAVLRHGWKIVWSTYYHIFMFIHYM